MKKIKFLTFIIFVIMILNIIIPSLSIAVEEIENKEKIEEQNIEKNDNNEEKILEKI